MANRYFTGNSDRKITASKAPKVKSKGPAPTPEMPLKSTGYKPAGSTWGSTFNRATKVPVPKTRPASHGID